MSVNVNEVLDNINVKVDFNNNINVILDNSGTGKSYLFTLLSAYFDVVNRPYIKINYEDDINGIKVKLSNSIVDNDKCVIIYDNADLTLTDEIYNLLQKCSATKIISIKSRYHIRGGDCGFYRLKYANGSIETKVRL